MKINIKGEFGMKRFAIAAISVLLLSWQFILSAEEKKETLRLGYFPNLTHAPALVGTSEGFFQKALGDNVKIDLKTFNAGPSLIEALFAGEIDIGYIGPNPAINGYVKSGGKALKIIAGSSSGGALFIVRNDAGINDSKDLQGKKLAAPLNDDEINKDNDLQGKRFASPQMGNTQDVALRAYIEKAGFNTVEKGGKVQVLPTQNPNILTLFLQKRVDGAWVPEPWGTRLVQEANGKIFLDERSLWPDGKFVTAHVIVSTEFLAKRPGLVKRFLAGHLAAIDFIAKNPEKARVIINNEIKRITTKPIPEDILEKSMKNIDITYDPICKSLVKSADDAFKLGYLGKIKPDLSGIYDLTILNSLLKEKGLPEIVK